MKSGILNIGFRITDRVNIRGASKLLFALTSNCKEEMVAFFYPLDLFKSPLVISSSCNDFQHGSGTNSTGTNLFINLISMQIVVVHYYSLSRAMKFVKILQLQFFEIDLDIYLEIKVFISCGCVYIKLVYCILVDNFWVSCLKVKRLSKESFQIDSFIVVGWDMRVVA